MRRRLLLVGVVAAVGAVVATINGVVDPKDEFYSGAPLTTALDSQCLLADDVIRSRSYPEFKRDLFNRRPRTTVVFDSSGRTRRGVNLGFPGFGAGTLLDGMRFLARKTPKEKPLSVYVVTDVSWFDPQASPRAFGKSLASKAAYLLSPWTLTSSLDLMRSSRTLAFSGWEKERVGGACVVNRGSPYPAWRADGTFTRARELGETAPQSFAWNRLSPLDAALAIAEERGWRVVGLSGLAPRWETYERELRALFAKHGYRWRIRRMQA